MTATRGCRMPTKSMIAVSISATITGMCGPISSICAVLSRPPSELDHGRRNDRVKLLVTGASGMVGRNLLADPRAQSHEIAAPTRAALDWRDAKACRDCFNACRPDAVVHLAATVGGIQANIDEPVRFLLDNTQIALNVLSSAREAGVRRFLNITSSC